MNTQELRNKVESLEAELKAFKQKLDEQLKTNEFEINYEKDCYLLDSDAEIYEAYGDTIEYKNFGVYRKTEELAEIARDNMRARNKLEELVHWLEPDWKPDWDNHEQEKYYIGYDYYSKKFGNTSNIYSKMLGTVYGSEDTTRKICNALNDGLLPELADILKGINDEI